jgi:hypothetical protein
MSATTASLLADLGVEVVVAPQDEGGQYVVVLVLAEVYDDEDIAELAAEEVHARLAEVMEADLAAPLRVPAERLSLPPGGAA